MLSLLKLHTYYWLPIAMQIWIASFALLGTTTGHVTSSNVPRNNNTARCHRPTALHVINSPFPAYSSNLSSAHCAAITLQALTRVSALAKKATITFHPVGLIDPLLVVVTDLHHVVGVAETTEPFHSFLCLYSPHWVKPGDQQGVL